MPVTPIFASVSDDWKLNRNELKYTIDIIVFVTVAHLSIKARAYK
jgi:hypothetical protein